YGAAEGDVAGRRARVEIRTVNHRWFNLALKLPMEVAAVELELRDALRRYFDRGHVNLQMRWVDPPAPAASIDVARAEAIVLALRDLQQRFGLGGEVTVDLVARQADIFGPGRGDEGSTVNWESLAPVVTAAADECRVARRREGAVLGRELGARFDELEQAATRIAALAPGRLLRERDRLAANVRLLLEWRGADERRIAEEIAIAAARLDITEELVRCGAHIAVARDALAQERAAGKQLGFLVQELGREINTLGSKANDAAISHEVVTMKSELEKVREQLESLE
ncbi:MAG: YicC family protein, partial [Gemmatimonadales bacterium]